VIARGIRALLAVAIAGVLVTPALTRADTVKDVAAMMLTEICAPALPDFTSAIKRGLEYGFTRLDDENIVMDDATSVSLTVVPASKTFLVINFPPLCVVTVPAPNALSYVPIAEDIAGKLGPITDRNGSTETLKGDGMAWTIEHGGTSIELQMLEEHSPFGDSVVFALIDYGDL